MIIESVRVKNFRAIVDETLHCENLTALVGANGAGKSSFLRALDLFYNAASKLESEDYYGGSPQRDDEITIAVTYQDLSDEAAEQFSAYMQGDKLTVECVYRYDGSKFLQSYYGSRLQNPDFLPVRQASSARDRRPLYDELRQRDEYADLPPWGRSQDEALAALDLWENNHPDHRERIRDDGRFFGFREVAQGYLGRYSQFLFIPAVRDASEDAADGRSSVLSDLMDKVIRSALSTNQDIVGLRQEVQQRYEAIMNTATHARLVTLGEQLSDTLRTFIPNTQLALQWLPLEQVNIPVPRADIRLIEDGYSSSVARTGHGSQRALILTLLQHLALAQVDLAEDKGQVNVESAGRLPDLVLAIEEPELYQHPNRQRHLSRILLQLANGVIPRVAERTQVVYATHSPLFVGIDRIDQIRLLKKVPAGEDNLPKAAQIVQTTVDEIAAAIWEADGRPQPQYTGSTLLPRLQTIVTPWMSEGFFADVVVLVEGEDDRAAVLGFAKAMGMELESSGISVIPCFGKRNLDRPTAIFQRLGIPVYVIWDSDFGEDGADPNDNRCLLRLLGHPPEDWPATVGDRFACFRRKLEVTLREELGNDAFNRRLEELKGTYAIRKNKDAIKCPAIIAELVASLLEGGSDSPTLRQIVERIVALKDVR